MAKKTAIIDLGSNGIRMAIYEKTSRFGFYLLNEQKVKFRLAQGTYEKQSFISSEQILNASKIIEHFQNLAKYYGCNKTICVGTSAIRDASNNNELIEKLRKENKLGVKILSGENEAYLGGFGAINLLPQIYENAVCIDIGGGSVEICLVSSKKIIKTCSLNLGTVRLKEIFKEKTSKLEKHIDESIKNIPKDFFAENLIAIGGSLRSISSAIMKKNSYPLNQVHSFTYKIKNEIDFIKKIIDCKNTELINLGIKKERLDTIKIGALVFVKIIEKIGAKNIITSGAGVREGVFLKDLLRRHRHFPVNFNPSLKSLEDRFSQLKITAISKNAQKIFDTLKDIHYVSDYYLKHLIYASKLCQLGTQLSYYSKHKHSAYLALNGLNFCINHNDKAVIATIIEQHGKKINYNELKLKKLLADENTIVWLNFILALSYTLNKVGINEICDFALEGKNFYIKKNTCNFILIDLLKKIHLPKKINIFINGDEL